MIFVWLQIICDDLAKKKKELKNYVFTIFSFSSRKTRLAKANFGAGAKKPNSEKVWEFFDQVVEDGDEAKCKTCLVMIKTDSGENISGLLSHLQVSHPEQHEEVQADTAEMDVKNVNTSGARNSPVWQFYSEIGSNRVKCNKCETVLKYYVSKICSTIRTYKVY